MHGGKIRILNPQRERELSFFSFAHPFVGIDREGVKKSSIAGKTSVA